ncbi:MAG: ATP-binding protein [Marinicellaceae bacterium]
MILPDIVKQFLLKQRKGQGFYCVEIDNNLKIVKSYGSTKEFGIQSPKADMDIRKFLPILLTESFQNDFEVPFYNISENHVCHVYFIKSLTHKYLVLVNKSEIFNTTQKYQQFAHDDNISKNKFKRLFEELKVAKNQLKKSNQEKATLIAMLSHELGTPLTSILGYSELLMNENIGIKKGLTIINKNAQYLKQMIENTLIFGKTEANDIKTQIEQIPLKDFFTVIKSIILVSAENKSLTIHIDTDNDKLINIDIARTKQIIINLLNNAVKYTDEGFIELKFSIKNNRYVFSIIDSGIGIPMDQQQTIFNPWERVYESEAAGSGIGLFISQKLALAIGAELSLKYSSKEFGSIFQLSVPIKEIPSLTQLTLNQITRACQDKSILIIDDDSDILDLIDAFLSSTGINIYTALDIKTALSIIHSKTIDIIMTDYNLGSIKTDVYVSQFKQKKDIPIVLMTALPDSKIKKQYNASGFVSVLPKPINSKNLIQTIVSHLT